MADQTFQKLEAEIQKSLSSSKNLVITESTSPSDIISAICSVYAGLKIVLRAILVIPLIPDSIKQPIKDFMELMNQICN